MALTLKQLTQVSFEDIRDLQGRRDPLNGNLIALVENGGDIEAVFVADGDSSTIIKSRRYGLCAKQTYTGLVQMNFVVWGRLE